MRSSLRLVLQTVILLSAGLAPVQADVTQHDVVPSLLLRCVVCHGARKQEGELDLRSRASMLRGGKSGPAFVPGKPEESRMLKRIQAEECPPRLRLIEATVKPMETDEVSKLARWIALGALEIPDEPDVAGTSADPLIRKEDWEFWSFRPPQPVTIPRVVHSDRVRNPIDAFVLQKLEEKGLVLSPEADRLALLRRATFDLTGLPPEPSEAEAFLADESPDAYSKLIERLLASPRYGERWGRHWLDVAGYADCEGRREQHLPRPFAWRYRDYVIRAFNADKPYDRFLLEQLAGDELADYEHAHEITQEIEDNLVATGFLRMAPDPTWANLTGFVSDRLEVMADAMDVLGSGVMGLTFKCARCHNHKFDPIPQRDYYRLLAVFKGAYDEHDWLKPETNSYGGAFSAGVGERYLPYVTTAERQRWQKHNAVIQQEVDALKAAPQTTNTDKQIKEIEARRLPEPRIMALWDRGETSQTYLYRRGNYLTAGFPVQPGVPAALTDGQTPFEVKPPWPGAKSTGRRLAFARWLTQPDNPLTARVMVNRIWKDHFGHGLVRSLGNFGKMGDKPTHPELLDWLAREFVRQGWSMKSMHRLMMTSSTYRQISTVTSRNEQFDPGNRLLSRMPLRRMEAEELRDSLLWIAGQLDETRFGPAEPIKARPDGLIQSGKRRSIYVQQLRKQPPSLLESFDLPAMNPNCLQRSESLVAPQALHLLNDTSVREMAAQFADRVLQVTGDEPTQQVQRIYWIALSRPPSAEEQQACLQMFTRLTRLWKNKLATAGKALETEATRKALTTICHTVMNSAAFLYLD
ncbi:MAG: PSD1 domain-containing protein [Verrucomicrobia bacterium]|nr:PSD1 domain-containing protein [Verrucomicrobiota bacterium]